MLDAIERAEIEILIEAHHALRHYSDIDLGMYNRLNNASKQSKGWALIALQIRGEICNARLQLLAST